MPLPIDPATLLAPSLAPQCFPAYNFSDLPNYGNNAALRTAPPPVDGEVVSVENPLRLWIYDADGYAGIPDDDLTLIKPDTVLLVDAGRWVPAEGRAVTSTFAQVRLAISGSCEILDVLGKATFLDGFQGIFDRRPVGAYVDDDTNILVTGAFAYIRRGNLIPVLLPNSTTVLMTTLTLPPGSTTNGSNVSIFKGGQSATDTDLDADASHNTLVVTLNGLPINSKFSVTLDARTIIWRTATQSASGSIECIVNLYITTDGAGVATCVVQTVPAPDYSLLVPAIATATMDITASAGGFTLSAVRPAGVACKARVKWWVVEFEVLP